MHIWRLIFLAALLALGADPAAAERRVALVIGESAYASVAVLPNPARDAAAMAELFRKAGFDEVRLETNRSAAELRKALRAFSDTAASADIAVVFYAGHGVEIGGRDFLVPVDARLLKDIDVDDEAIDLDYVLTRIPAKRLKLIILDACRENPFKTAATTRSVGRGLTAPDVRQSDTLIAFAARPGELAADGDGEHSPYTAALLRHLTEPGVELDKALRLVRDEVRASGRRQEPWSNGSRGAEDVFFGPPAAAAQDVSQAEFAAAMQAGTAAALDGFLGKYSSGPLAEIARRERDRLRKAAQKPEPSPHIAIGPEVAPPSAASPCGGATPASSSTRGATPLTRGEECALTAGAVFRECESCPTMVVVPAGSFTMGSPEGEEARSDDEGPQHRVGISQAFAVGKFTVTFDEGEACVAGGGCGGYRPEDAGWGRGLRPVINVSWNDAQAYVAWLKRKTGKEYRLLSESEWEYSARGGTRWPFWWGSSISTSRANYNGWDTYNGGQSGEWRRETVPVDSFTANPFGLYQMHGNVWQWIEDCYHENYNEAPADGSVWTTGGCDRRILRGGAWNDDPRGLRAAVRLWIAPVFRNYTLGLRVARTLTL